MGLLDRLTGMLSAKKVRVGNTEPICPYCGAHLDKMPGRKKKCPACNQFILVRTWPDDRKRILIREDQVLQVEEAWAIANGTHDQFVAARRQHEAERRQLQKRIGREPSANELKWAQLKSGLEQFAREQQWGLYRNNRLAMGDILKKEKKYGDALNVYFEVCYIDLNGPNNIGTTDPEILREFPPFNPREAMLAPGVIGYVERMMQHEKLTKSQVQARFVAIAAKIQQSLKLPISPEKAWLRLAKELR